MQTLTGQEICSYATARQHCGDAAPHMLTAKETCKQFGLTPNELFWLCVNGMPFYEQCNPTDVHPATREILDPKGITISDKLERWAGLRIQLPKLEKPLTQLKFDFMQGYFWGGAIHGSIEERFPADYAVFYATSETSWEVKLTEKFSTLGSFIADGAKKT